MAKIQYFEQTQNELRELIAEELRKQIRDFRKDFQPKEPTEYMTRNQVAQMLNVDLSTIHNWVRSKKIRAYSIGARVYFKRHEIEEDLKSINE